MAHVSSTSFNLTIAVSVSLFLGSYSQEPSKRTISAIATTNKKEVPRFRQRRGKPHLAEARDKVLKLRELESAAVVHAILKLLRSQVPS